MTSCGARQTILERNPYADNKTPMHRLIDPIFRDVHDDSIAYLLKSDDCEIEPSDEDGTELFGEELAEPYCPSGPNNVLVTFTDCVY